MRFHWLVNKNSKNIETLRFTRAIFGLVQLPFLLNATIKEHLRLTKEDFPEKKKINKLRMIYMSMMSFLEEIP